MSELVEAVLHAIAETDVKTIEVRAGSWKIRVLRDFSEEPLQDSNADAGGIQLLVIEAPLAGVFYARSSPESPPFVSEGDVVIAGQTVGLIETMKLFNEVVSDRDGTVVTIVASEGDLVEKGEPLMRIAPHETIWN